ncbi:MAG: nitrite reductase [Desulfuromonas sp.]|nr:MAG: nitrite reductase [Desulfuromonas sp.]
MKEREETVDPRQWRIDGIYQQAGDNRFMQRIKVPAGVLGASQARQVAELADRFAGARLHLTCRGSIELHDLAAENLPEIGRRLALVGLTGRGACGGAVRGVSSSATFSSEFASCQVLARRLHRHFAGHPAFEGLPKKFKIGVEGDASGGRHLIQDLGLVHAGVKENRSLWDVWCAGGLGREPQAGFLLGERIPEERIIPLTEGILRVYREHAAPGRRLKHLLRERGEKEFRHLLRQATGELYPPQVENRFAGSLTVGEGSETPVIVPVFAGELSTRLLLRLADAAELYAADVLLLTSDQDIAFLPATNEAGEALARWFRENETDTTTVAHNRVCRACPGNHECRMGLVPTREVAAEIGRLADQLDTCPSIAISGCPNSCSQPQLADIGIVGSRLVKGEDGARTPRFQVWRRTGLGLGEQYGDELTYDELLNTVQRLIS